MTQAQLLIELTTEWLEVALDDHPSGETEMGLVEFAIDQVEMNLSNDPDDRRPDLTDATIAWSRTDAFRACALGLLQTMKAVA